MRQLAAAGGDLSAVRAGLDRALRLSLAYDLAAISTVDPATMLWTSCFISGMPPGGEDERERILYGLEFDGDDINSYTELANSGRLVGRLHQATDPPGSGQSGGSRGSPSSASPTRCGSC